MRVFGMIKIFIILDADTSYMQWSTVLLMLSPLQIAQASQMWIAFAKAGSLIS